MKTVVLDDDPTGTQSASGVTVLLEYSTDLIADALADADSVYVQTNSRAIGEAAAVALVTDIRRQAVAAGLRIGETVQFVLRGDSTLRGHVFAETEVFAGPESIIVFLPAFPAGGRTTLDGTHYVEIDGRPVPAHETEFADDPVFGFTSGVLREYVTERSGRASVAVPLADLRAGRLGRLLADVPPGSVVLPDSIVDGDVRLVANAIQQARAAGRDIVVRCASPLAAMLAGVESRGLLPVPLVDRPVRVLLACGSHTGAATAQLAAVAAAYGAAAEIGTRDALADPARAGLAAASRVRSSIDERGVAVIATERVRTDDNSTLEHGERVMAALTAAVAHLVPVVDVVVAKGGITSAELARRAIGAPSAVVLGQVLPGVSVWRLVSRAGREMLYVVVPGNVGGPSTLTDVLLTLGHGGDQAIRVP